MLSGTAVMTSAVGLPRSSGDAKSWRHPHRPAQFPACQRIGLIGRSWTDPSWEPRAQRSPEAEATAAPPAESAVSRRAVGAGVISRAEEVSAGTWPKRLTLEQVISSGEGKRKIEQAINLRSRAS